MGVVRREGGKGGGWREEVFMLVGGRLAGLLLAGKDRFDEKEPAEVLEVARERVDAKVEEVILVVLSR